jgi:hypothetical protein
MGETVALVSGDGYFGINGHCGVTSSGRGYLSVSVPHLQALASGRPGGFIRLLAMALVLSL